MRRMLWHIMLGEIEIMHRNKLRALLHRYAPTEPQEIMAREQMLQFLDKHADCFERGCIPGHFTASAWLLNKDHSQALLTHHAKFDVWIQLGGHCDGDSDVLQVALKEAREESGLINITPVSREIFDIDVHSIPAWKHEPEHLHYDVRFLLQVTDDAPLVINHESKALQWFEKDLSALPTRQTGVLRMFNKWHACNTVKHSLSAS